MATSIGFSPSFIFSSCSPSSELSDPETTVGDAPLPNPANPFPFTTTRPSIVSGAQLKFSTVDTSTRSVHAATLCVHPAFFLLGSSSFVAVCRLLVAVAVAVA